jgi:hypothetical protein
MTRLDPTRLAAAILLAAGGWFHAELYVHGYRVIPYIGPMFLLQGAGSFAVALLLLCSDSPVLRLGAVGLAGGALAGFAASRTVGVFGFSETGFDPAPQALLSVLAEVAVVALIGVGPLRSWLRARR